MLYERMGTKKTMRRSRGGSDRKRRQPWLLPLQVPDAGSGLTGSGVSKPELNRFRNRFSQADLSLTWLGNRFGPNTNVLLRKVKLLPMEYDVLLVHHKINQGSHDILHLQRHHYEPIQSHVIKINANHGHDAMPTYKSLITVVTTSMKFPARKSSILVCLLIVGYVFEPDCEHKK